MGEQRSRYLKELIGTDEKDKAAKKGRKHFTTSGAGEQAFNLRVDLKDGRKKRGIGWSHYSDYQWSDDGDSETLILIFGLRIVTIHGFNLMVLVTAIDEGKLETFEELMATEVRELQSSGDDDAIVTGVEFYPTFEEIIKTIKGENDDEDDTGNRP